MASSAGENDDELEHVAGCLHGDAEALAWVRGKCHSNLLHILLSRGASPTEAEDLLADLWSDCVPGNDDKASFLAKFNGKCKLLGWLSTVATRRWIDFKRRQSRNVSPSGNSDDEDRFEHGQSQPPATGEDALVEILRTSLQTAFSRCSFDALVLLRLRFVHKLSQRELAQMMGWHESKISRQLSETMQQIQTLTLAEISAHDPWLSMTWDDFLDLCNSLETEFL